MLFVDKLTLDRSAIRKTKDGYAVAEVPVARTGIQDYAGWEVGRPDMARVRVYRPPETVFDDAYIASMAHKPITDGHPSEPVTSENWKEYARGQTGDTIRKDEANGLVYVPMMLSDQELIDKVESGQKEVSCGYTCELVWGDGETPEGARYDAMQRSAIINHIASVKKGRAGFECRIGDNWAEFNDDKEPSVANLKTITYDGVPLEATDAAEAVINKLVAARDSLADELKAETKALADAKVAHDAEIVAKDAEIAKLTKELADAKVTPEMIRDAAKQLADAQAKATALEVEFADDADAEAIQKAVVDAKMGDAAKDYTADQIAIAFAALTKDAKPAEQSDPVRDALKDGTKTNDAETKAAEARAKMIADMANPFSKQDA